ncbi:DNA replication helicase [Phaffia rhodozyma]|uniref:DNA replication ATP-dependent helicase/nuclease n=1 Tax=Phaffia rhodozyma TaxID=264483 RepID=A0A0F7SFE9_PHARH|nr:DNA replication helicase [Phaffia rhodozyma]
MPKTAQEEAEFMQTLLSGLTEDDLFSESFSSPSNASIRTRQPVKQAVPKSSPSIRKASTGLRKTHSEGSNVPTPVKNTPASTRPTQSTSNILQNHPLSKPVVSRTLPGTTPRTLSTLTDTSVRPPHRGLRVSSKAEDPSIGSQLETSGGDYSSLLDGIQFDLGSDDWSSSPDNSPTRRTKDKPALINLNPPPTEPPPDWKPKRWVRCNVIEVRKCEGKDARGFSIKEVDVSIHQSEERLLLILREDFADLPICAREHVNVISSSLDFVEDDSVEVKPGLSTAELKKIIFASDFPENFLIYHPDLLIPNTTISSGLSCSRKSVLQRLTKTSSKTTKSLLYGNIQHTSLQSLFSTRPYPTRETFSPNNIRQAVEATLSDETMKGEIYRAGLSWDEVWYEVKEKAAVSISRLAEKFMVGIDAGCEPKDEAYLHNSKERLALTGLHDIEEDIRSPMWGLQGKIDVSIQATLLDTGLGSGSAGKKERTSQSWTMPFEIKTGRAVGVMEHRAQTMLYTLLMEDRYATPIPAGLLYYTQSDTIMKVPAARFELRSLIMARNIIASYFSKKRSRIVKKLPMELTSLASEEKVEIENVGTDLNKHDAAVISAAGKFEAAERFLPPHIEDSYSCKKCYQVDSCMLYRRAVENVLDVDSPVAEIYIDKTSHLTDNHTEFFKTWEQLISLEEQDVTRFQAELWTMTAVEREKKGRCFAGMRIESYTLEIGTNRTKVHRHNYTFIRHLSPTTPSLFGTNNPESSLLTGHLSVGDPVTVSIEPNLLSLSRGFILELSSSSIVVGLDHTLDVNVLLARTRRVKTVNSMTTEISKPTFRIDKDELATGMGRIRDNLAQLFYSDAPAQLRSLVVDLRSPLFDQSQAPLPQEIPSILNTDQTEALTKVLTARDYALVLGMPGTGKTTTIVEIIKALSKRGKSVLLTSYTHSAVDTILTKLIKTDVKILRLGNPDKVHPDISHLTLGAQRPADNLEEFERRLMSPQVIATTALTIDHPLFAQRTFDYCIVDEASQITLPVCLGPLRFARTFILVGDHFQLPPLVKNPSARLGGLETSLFRRLHEAHPTASVDLSYQYRMNKEIMSLSNELIYEGKLRCGSDMVEKQALNYPTWDKLEDMCARTEGEHWLKNILKPERKVVFIDTDNIPCRESRIGDLVQNTGEATLVQRVCMDYLDSIYCTKTTSPTFFLLQIVQGAVVAGLMPCQVAVITLYRQQIKLLQQKLEANINQGVEILTADKSQGRDKDCVIVSMVRSNEQGSVGELLRDWRRINVAFTRAKSKLIIIGSSSTLSCDTLLARFLQLMKNNGRIASLNPDTIDLSSSSDSIMIEPSIVTSTLQTEDEASEEAASIEKVRKWSSEVSSDHPIRTEDVEGEQGCLVGSSAEESSSKSLASKKMKIGRQALVKSRPLIRDILNDTIDVDE